MVPKGRKKKSNDIYPCAKCNQQTDDESLQCSFCDSWTHDFCISDKTDVIKHFNDGEVSNSPFCCKSCNPDSIKKDLIHYKKLLIEHAELKTNFDTLVRNTDKIDDVSHKLDELHNQFQIYPTTNDEQNQSASGNDKSATSMTPWSEVAKKKRHPTPHKVAPIVHDIRKIEQEDLQRRSIVISGLNESTNESENDFDIATELCKALDPSCMIQTVFRMGIYKPSSDAMHSRPRLLKVHLSSSSVVKSILTNAHRLKDLDHYKGVFVRRSMSKAERDELKDRCSLLNDTASLSRGFKHVVRNGSIIRFMNCSSLADGKLGRGTFDKSFKPDRKAELIRLHEQQQSQSSNDPSKGQNNTK